MPNRGSIVARVYTSAAQLPIAGAPVWFTARNAYGGKDLVAFRLTDADGYTAPVSIVTPDDTGVTLQPGSGVPYAAVTITTELAGFDRIVVEDAQIFTNTKTVQELMLVPSSSANGIRRTETFTVPGQNL